MNEMNDFNKEIHKSIPEKEELQRLGIGCYMLYEALLEEKEEDSWVWLNKSSEVLWHSKIFNSIRNCVAKEIARRNSKNEYYYQRLFDRVANRLLKGANPIHLKTNGKDIPDSFIDLNGETLPIEVKIGDFDKKAKQQLERYINNYNCERGIAVGRNLTVDLPENITFFSLKELEYELNTLEKDKIRKWDF